MRPRRGLLVSVAVLVGALLKPSPASSDIGIHDLTPRNGRSGDVVRLTADGFLGPKPWPAMAVVMVAAAQAPRPRPCGTPPPRALCSPAVRYAALKRPPFRLVGVIRRWRESRLTRHHGTGSIVFRIPSVKRGRYVFGLFCSACARGPKGSLIIARSLVLTVR